MPRHSDLNPEDLAHLAGLGIDEREADRQLEQLRNPPPATRLEAPCTPGNGILRLQDRDHDELLNHWRALVDSHHVVKFVPASGAASRMFKALKSYLSTRGEEAEAQDAARRFLDNLERFAFYPELERVLASSPAADGEGDRARWVLETLLSADGMGFESHPKGLIPFHRYDSGPRTAASEHLIEGHRYLAVGGSPAHFHFTVSHRAQESFQREISAAAELLRQQSGPRAVAHFSVQNRSTDTLAIEPDGKPFRSTDGKLLLRPSGHGALIENLASLDAEVVYIKNIDNIARQRYHNTTVLWKRLLGGLFGKLQRQCFALAQDLEEDPTNSHKIEAVLRFLESSFALRLPGGGELDEPELRCKLARDRIARPIRIAGMVRNEREPGGGPFWVRNRDGTLTGQIVEGSQVDLHSNDQKQAWKAATHLNPVDLVCGLTDRSGARYALDDFIDPSMAFVTRKSHGGRPLVALERPGLWNGSMAGWNTVFVEVPIETFTPVKTIFDLLRPEHQPLSDDPDPRNETGR